MFNVGAKVKYSRKWLKSVGMYTGDLCFCRGLVTGIEMVGPTLRLAVIEWDKEDIPLRVNVKNLVEVGKPELE